MGIKLKQNVNEVMAGHKSKETQQKQLSSDSRETEDGVLETLPQLRLHSQTLQYNCLLTLQHLQKAQQKILNKGFMYQQQLHKSLGSTVCVNCCYLD